MVMAYNKNHKRAHTCADCIVCCCFLLPLTTTKMKIKIAIARTAQKIMLHHNLSSEPLLLLALLFFRERIKIAILLITIL